MGINSFQGRLNHGTSKSPNSRLPEPVEGERITIQ
jgi:hypothetical protein